MGKAMIVIPTLVFVILLGLMWYFKPPFVAAKDSTGKRSLVWKRALISDIVLTIAAVVVIFMFAPEVMTMF
jgi:hypothetical protein